MTRCAASAIVWMPEEQNRFTVIPDVVIGQPARIAIWRAMFQPVAPSGLAQPMITSSTSAASRLARSIACLTAWPPIVAPWVMLSAPRQDLQSGVRAVETITASVMEDLPGGRACGRGCAVGTPGLSANRRGSGSHARAHAGELRFEGGDPAPRVTAPGNQLSVFPSPAKRTRRAVGFQNCPFRACAYFAIAATTLARPTVSA